MPKVDSFAKIETHIESVRNIVNGLKEAVGDAGQKEHVLKLLKDFEQEVFDLEEGANGTL